MNARKPTEGQLLVTGDKMLCWSICGVLVQSTSSPESQTISASRSGITRVRMEKSNCKSRSQGGMRAWYAWYAWSAWSA
ncbi:hypothetical protein E6O75_ATG09810 [Venturia nashicola]|uniref:Uncharacterized protein n=1 Tax=Venturia nashicola TaxID=86259 RepID=A0A4Z1NRR8_9PEZI|nr:hypothetical protein E6O75_ATG09810 [Venturia nashicola]